MPTTQYTKIETGQKYDHPSARINMLEQASDRAVVLCKKDELPIGTKVLLMHSGLMRVIATKTSDISVDLKVVATWNARRYRKGHSTYHNVYGAILDLEDSLTERN